MKRILSLFLSMVLVLSMISGTIIAEASTLEDVKLVKAIDTTGRNYNDYKSDIAEDIWDYSYISQSGSENDLTAMNLKYTRSDKQSAMRITVSPIGEKASSGVHTVKFKMLSDNDINSDGIADFAKNYIIVNRVGSGSSGWDGTFNFPQLAVGRWYEFKIVFDLDAMQPHSVMEVRDVASDACVASNSFNVKNSNGYTNMWMYITYTAGTNANLLIKDMAHISDFGETKAKITSVGSDGSAVIPHSQNKVKFTLDRELPGLTKDHVLVKSRQGGSDIAASAITVTSDATAPSDAQWIVEATLSQELAAWSEYSVAISADYYDGYKEVSGSSYVPVSDITKDFTTPSAPLDIRTPEFENDGTATTDIISNIGNTDMTLIYTNTASGGYIKEIKTESISVNGELNDKTISFDDAFVSGDTAKLFVIKSWNNPAPLFDKTWAERYDGTVPEADEAVATSDALPGEITFGEFDYTGKKMDVNINVGSDAGSVNGVLYIYKRGTALKDNLIYADYVTTTANGSLKKGITFAPDIADTTGEYTAAFYADGIALSEDFPIYDSAAAFGGNVLKSAINAKGVKYNAYKSDITESILSGSTGVSHTSTTFDEDAMNITFSREDKESGYRINIYPGTGKQTEGVHTVKFKFYADKAKEDGTIDWLHGEDFAAEPGTWERGYITVNRVSSDNIDGSYDLKALRASTWYEIEIKFDLEDTYKSYITVTNVATGEKVIENNMAIKGTNGFTNMWMYLAYDTETSANNLMLIKDLQILADYGDMKSVIRYIGENDSVDYNQNEISFKISEDNGLTKDNIRVKDAQGNITKAKSITVTEDMGEYVVTAVMEKNFVSYKKYTLEVDSVGYEEYVEYADGEYVAVKPLTRAFTTPAAPLDITDPVITSDGSSVTFTADISNTSGSIVNATTILTVVSSDGITRSVTADSDSLSGADTKSFSNTNAFALGNTANYFVIKDFANPVQLFDKTWSVNYDGSYPAPAVAKATAKASAKTIALDEFEYNTSYDHKNNKIVVNLNTGKNDFVSGVLYVYSGDVMSDGNLPVYAAYITTAADGTLEMEIPFDSSFASVSGSYKVAFYSSELDSAMEKGFDVYSSSDYANYKRLNILARAKASSTFSGLKQIITGTDDMGNVVDDAWTIFSGDADVSVYNTLKNKEAVFVSLSLTVKSLANYDALCDAFERLAIVQKNKENNPTPSAPSANNKNTGSSSVSMSATPAAGSSNAGASVGGGSVFSDMSGHWGQKYAESLVAKGIVNGYADGSFRGDNPITRAELTKIVVEALDVPEANGAVFGDVNSSSWYADYVSRANASGVVNGFEDGSFRPEANVSRQDAVLMIYRAMNLTAKLPEGYKFFADEKDIQDYASDAIRCLGDLGIITGTDSKFMPKNNITRAEMAAVICRALDYMESHMQ